MKKLFSQPIPLLFLLLFALWFCDKEYNAERPFIRLLTLQPTNLNESGVTLNAEFLDLSGENVTSFGFFVDSNRILSNIGQNPNVLKYVVTSEPAKVGKFSYRLESNLNIGTIYHVRPFAYQRNLLVLGEEVTFRSQGGAVNPLISSFTPTAIVPGDTLTISGKYFLLGSSKISAKLGGKNAEIVGTPSDTQIKILAPLGLPQTGKVELTIGSVNLTSEQSYQRLKPIILSAPSTMKYGTSYLLECQNLSKYSGSNLVQIGSNGKYENCTVLQQNRGTLLIKLDENASYTFTGGNDSLRLWIENLSDRKTISLQNPVLSSISPNKGMTKDEITLQVEGISPNKYVTRINWNGNLLVPEHYSILPGANTIRLKIPEIFEYPQEISVAVQLGQLRSNTLKFNLDTKVVNLTQSQRNWHYAFSLNEHVYLGTRAAGAPMQGIDPLKINATLENVTSSSNEIYEYAFPTENGHVIALSQGTNGGLNGHFLEINPNHTIIQLSKSPNTISLKSGASKPGLMKGTTLNGNEQGYIYVANGTSNFWGFNPSNARFEALAPIPRVNNNEPSDVVLLNPGPKIIAVATYPGQSTAYVMEYLPGQNGWHALYNFNFGNSSYLDGFVYPFAAEPGWFFMLSNNDANRYTLCGVSSTLAITVGAYYNKPHETSKKSTFLIKETLVVVDDESIYRNKIRE